MTNLIKTNDPDYCRDEHSKAIINTNANAYKLYKQQRASQNKIKTMTEEVSDLKSEVDNLKKLVQELVREKHGNTNF